MPKLKICPPPSKPPVGSFGSDLRTEMPDRMCAWKNRSTPTVPFAKSGLGGGAGDTPGALLGGASGLAGGCSGGDALYSQPTPIESTCPSESTRVKELFLSQPTRGLR